MPASFLIGCPHFGHNNIYNFVRYNGEKVRPFTSVIEGDAVMVENWNNTVSITDKVYVLGDVAFSRRNLDILNDLNGKKILIKGNHDTLNLNDYKKYFKDVRATHKMNNTILSHIPIHPESLGKEFDEKTGLWKNRWYNIHAHLHSEVVMLDGVEDPRYFSVCVERINYTPISTGLEMTYGDIRQVVSDTFKLETNVKN